MLKIALIHVKLWNTPLVPLFVQLALWCSDWCFLISVYFPPNSFNFLLHKLFWWPLERNLLMVKWFFFPMSRRNSMYGTRVKGLISKKYPEGFTSLLSSPCLVPILSQPSHPACDWQLSSQEGKTRLPKWKPWPSCLFFASAHNWT